MRPLTCWVCGFEFRRRHGWLYLSLASVVFCRKDFSSTGRSLFQRSPNEYVVSECDCEASIMRGPWPTMCFCAMEKKTHHYMWKGPYVSPHILKPRCGWDSSKLYQGHSASTETLRYLFAKTPSRLQDRLIRSGAEPTDTSWHTIISDVWLTVHRNSVWIRKTN
jgi:hypothetical protein